MDFWKDLVWDSILGAVLTAVLPGWLVWAGPIIKIFTDKLYGALKLVVDLKNVVIINNDFRLAYNAASVRLQLLLDQQGPESEAFKNARKENQKALSKLVQFAPPPA